MIRYQLLPNDFTEVRLDERGPKIRLCRIISLVEFTLQDGTVIPQYTIGGYVQSESNLPQDDNAWLFNFSKAFQNSVVKDGSVVRDSASIFGSAVVSNSFVSGHVHVLHDAIVTSCELRGKVTVRGGVLTKSTVINSVQIYESPKITNCHLSDGCFIHGAAVVIDSKVSDTAELSGTISVTNCSVGGRYVGNSGKFNGESLFEDEKLTVTRGFDEV